MTTYVAFSMAWPLRKSNAIALRFEAGPECGNGIACTAKENNYAHPFLESEISRVRS